MKRNPTPLAGPDRRFQVRTELPFLIALAALTLGSRWAAHPNFLWSWDSVLFALGIERYDLEAARPHLPGFPVYVGVARVFYYLIGDHNTAMVALGALSSALGVVALYFLARNFGSIRTAMLCVVLFACDPVLFFQGTIASSYATEAPVSVGLALLAWHANRRPTMFRMSLLGFLWALAIGLRQSLLFTTTPLIVWSILAHSDPMHARLKRASVLGFGTTLGLLTWFIPVITATGLQTWFELTQISSPFVFGHTVFNEGTMALQFHFSHLMNYLRIELLIFLLLVAPLLAVFRRSDIRGILSRKKELGFFAAWLAPGILFMVLVYSGYWYEHSGYTLVFLPGLYLLSTMAGEFSLERILRFHVPNFKKAMAISVPLLLLVPSPVLATEAYTKTRDQIHERSILVRSVQAFAELPPQTAGILTAQSWIWAKWYLPHHLVWFKFSPPEKSAPTRYYLIESHNREDDVPVMTAYGNFPNVLTPNHTIPSSLTSLVLLDGLMGSLREEVEVKEATLSNGQVYRYFTPDSSRSSLEEYFPPRRS